MITINKIFASGNNTQKMITLFVILISGDSCIKILGYYIVHVTLVFLCNFLNIHVESDFLKLTQVIKLKTIPAGCELYTGWGKIRKTGVNSTKKSTQTAILAIITIPKLRGRVYS